MGKVVGNIVIVINEEEGPCKQISEFSESQQNMVKIKFIIFK